MKKTTITFLILGFISVCCSTSYSQESDKNSKKLYKISPALMQTNGIKELEVNKGNICVYSCETNLKSNQAVVTFIKDGSVSKESYVINEIKK